VSMNEQIMLEDVYLKVPVKVLAERSIPKRVLAFVIRRRLQNQIFTWENIRDDLRATGMTDDQIMEWEQIQEARMMRREG